MQTTAARWLVFPVRRVALFTFQEFTVKKWSVKLTIRKFGMQCRSCKQVFECEVVAANEVEAAQFAKEQSGANPETHKFSIDYIRSLP